MATIRFTTEIEGVAADVDSVVLSDPTGTYGVKRNDTGAAVVPDGTAMTRTGAGAYTYDFDGAEEGVEYTFYVEWSYAGAVHYVENIVVSGRPAGWVNVQ